MFNLFKKKKNDSPLLYLASKYINENLEKNTRESTIRFSLKEREKSEPSQEEIKQFANENKNLFNSLSMHINENNDTGFLDKLFYYINRSGENDADIYRRAYIDRRLYSKIISDKTYRTSKDTIISLGVALKLTLQELNDLLGSGGYALSHSSIRDLIIEFCFKRSLHDIDKINELLYYFKEKVL